MAELFTEGGWGSFQSVNPGESVAITLAANLLFVQIPGQTFPAAAGVFTDVLVGYWADKWIEQLAAEGITGGGGTGVYCPDDSVTRAQMAVFLVKTFNLP